MVAPLVLIGGGMVAGAMALWAAIRQAPDLSKPIKTRKGNGVRILTSQRISTDGCPIVAAVNCGGDIGEVISIYTKVGVFGGTLWTMDERRAGSLSELGERDFTGLINASEPVPAPLPPEPVGVVNSIPRPPLDFSRAMRTQLGNRVQILAMDRIDLTDNQIVALVHLQWLDNDPLDGPQADLKAVRTGVPRGATVTEQVVNVYNKFGHFHGTVISEAEAESGKAYLNSPKFDLKRDMSDLCYSALSAN
jgi:hypothetical protein